MIRTRETGPVTSLPSSGKGHYYFFENVPCMNLVAALWPTLCVEENRRNMPKISAQTFSVVFILPAGRVYLSSTVTKLRGARVKTIILDPPPLHDCIQKKVIAY